MNHGRIVTACASHISLALQLLCACRDAMRAQGNDQWDDLYPNEQTVISDVSCGSLHVIEGQGETSLLAAITLNEQQDPAYQTLHWSCGEPVLVVHQLCVHPAYQLRGIGGALMDFAEQYAKQRAYASIRLDA